MVLKIFTTLRTHWKKSIFFTGVGIYASKYVIKWHKEDQLMRQYCLKAREFGQQKLSASERPRKIIVFLNPAAKDGKTKYLLEKHVLPLLHLAGIEIHVVRTEHEGQAKAYMSVIDNSIVDAIVVAGGDGTLSEIVTGLLRRGDEVAQRIPIGVLPFGNRNSFATSIFPEKELEVERYCEACMAIIGNQYTLADVVEVQQIISSPPDESVDESVDEPEVPIDNDTEEGGNKSVYILSDLKWGVHSDIARLKSKYWYMPGPLKEYYCYLKTILFGDWPPHVEASLELSPPCDGCRSCYTPPQTADVKHQPSPAKSVWWWPTDNRKKHPALPTKPDPRLEVLNPDCGTTYRKEVSTPQLNIATVRQSGGSCSSLEIKVNPETSKGKLLTERSSISDDECIPVSSVKIEPRTMQPCYIMDNEKFEVMPAKFTLLKDKIKIFTIR